MIELFRISFLSVTLIDVIDIVIVTMIFYWIYRALRATVAVQILVGLVILIAASFVVNSSNMKALGWIINTITSIWLLAFIVLFQPELRRVLTLITQTRLFRVFVRSNINQTIDEVIDATKELSDKHIGALIVFARTQNVKVTVETGIPLQANVSTELLLSIFNPRSPLHDGAVVLENQTLIAARCVLPLSTVKKLYNRNLGTRHRAALGIAEQMDVLVVVVSEETGGISIAQDAELTMNIPHAKLRFELQERLAEKKTVKEAFEEIVSEQQQ
ncbi:MAG: TIGR00159 family protein [Candidatus Kapabacteria bacterium]|nr:TIGR00159 family protein [Candidatus Kapabacteria bacterium]